MARVMQASGEMTVPAGAAAAAAAPPPLVPVPSIAASQLPTEEAAPEESPGFRVASTHVRERRLAVGQTMVTITAVVAADGTPALQVTDTLRDLPLLPGVHKTLAVTVSDHSRAYHGAVAETAISAGGIGYAVVVMPKPTRRPLQEEPPRASGGAGGMLGALARLASLAPLPEAETVQLERELAGVLAARLVERAAKRPRVAPPATEE